MKFVADGYLLTIIVRKKLMEVKCLSIRNPYAYLISAGCKDVENRNWKTSYRGRIFIHVSGNPMPYPISEEYIPVCINEESTDPKYRLQLNKFNSLISDHYRESGLEINSSKTISNKNLWYFQSQRIIGYVDLVDIITNSESPWALENNYHWVLENPVLLKTPICSVKGKLSLWNYELDESIH